jgi:hypothetical protein
MLVAEVAAVEGSSGREVRRGWPTWTRLAKPVGTTLVTIITMVADEDEVDSPEDEDVEAGEGDTGNLLRASTTTTGVNNNNHFDRLVNTTVESRDQ